ncbi:hypothetical protein D3C86_1791770 [compost metagenome]
MVPWPHMPRYPALLKKITPAAFAGFGHVARAQIGKAGDDKPGGFTAGMGVDDTDLIH